MSLIRSTPEAEQALGLIHSYRPGIDSTAPIVLFVHGRAGSLDIMSIFRRCVPAEFGLVQVQAPIVDPNGGFSWWEASRGRHAGEATAAAETLLNFSQRFPQHYGSSPRQLLAVGFSQGGAVLSLIGQHQPTVFAGIGLLASFVFRELKAAPTSPLPRFFIAHGTTDETVPVETARTGAEYLRGLGTEVTYIEEEVNHKVGTAGMRGLTGWISSFT